jgi:methionyl-tRNA formyltransferase
MKKIILLTSNQHAVSLIHFLRTEYQLQKVLIGEEGAPLVNFFKVIFPTIDFEIFNPKKLKLLLTNDSTVIVFGFKHIFKGDIFQSGANFFNIHFGKLPEQRGPDPLFWTLKNGQQQACITIHELTSEVDAGPVLFEKQVPVSPSDNYGMLHAQLSAQLIQGIQPVVNGLYARKEQDKNLIDYKEKPSDQDLTIKWREMEAATVQNLVNACNPKYQGALTYLNGSAIRVIQSSIAFNSENTAALPGTITKADQQHGVVVSCKNNTFLKLEILSITEGIFTGERLSTFGMQAQMRFQE